MKKYRNVHLTPLPPDRAVLAVDSIGMVRHRVVGTEVVRERWKSWQLMYTVRGCGVADIGSRTVRSKADTIWIMPADRAHRYRPDPTALPWQYQWLEFSGRCVPDLLRMMRLYRRPAVPDCGPIRPVVQELVDVVQARGNAAQHEAAALLMQILSGMEQCVLRSRQDHSAYSQLAEAARRFCADHLDEPVQLYDIAERLGVSGCHLIRTFQAQYGVSPMRYLRQLRVSRAKALLYRAELNITEVGQRVGYPRVQHFSRTFKEVTGLSPRDFRRQISATAEA